MDFEKFIFYYSFNVIRPDLLIFSKLLYCRKIWRMSYGD